MKKIILGLTLLSSLFAFASTDKVLIYDSLDIQETPLNAPRTQLTYQKSVGGLSCTKVNDIVGGDAVRNTSATCTLNLSKINPDAIYDALDIEEVRMTAPSTQLTYQKSVGGLSCIKVNDIVGGDATKRNRVDCTLTF